MRTRLVLFSVLLLLVLIAVPAAIAQVQSLTERNSPWEKQIIIGLPGDDDEGDDEGDDCPPYPAPVAATGQTECWDQVGNPIDCAGTGQDGEYQMGVSADPRFTDNGDGTVTDNLTGLIWLKDANCFGLRNWTNALADANTLADGSCGLIDGSLPGDWRLPNLGELQSLIDYGHWNPTLPPGHLFSGVQSNFYWSSTTFVYYPDSAWRVTLRHGYVYFDDKWVTYYVWPVRGGQ